METLEQLYIPQLQQLKAKTVTRDASRCFATFDGTVCEGDMIAVKADDYCLITRFHLKMNSDLELVEHHQRSLCIVEYSPNVASDYRGEDACCEKRCPRIVNVLARRGPGKKRMLKKGCCYEATCVTYLPEYFDAIDIPLIGDFDEISALIPSLEDGLITLHLKGLLEDLDLDTAQKPSGRYFFRSIALQALCQVMDMAYELSKLSSVGVGGHDLRLVQQVMEIVESSLEHIPSIHELSGMLYVGHTQLCETFKETTGMTIGEYARERRMKTAKLMLRNPGITIKEVSRRVGYRTIGGFSSTFKQLVGMTPRQYRLSNASAKLRPGAVSVADELDLGDSGLS